MKEKKNMTWFYFALLTICMWGSYGVLLHTGQLAMGDPQLGRYKAFFVVGLAYFLVAVIAPAIFLWLNKSDWHFTGKGFSWSLIAGVAGAIGAFGVVLAFGAKGHPAVVMALVFGGAPIVNAIIATLWHPPAGGLAAIKWQFVVGILLVALGGAMVTLFRPMPAPKKAPEVAQAAPNPSE